MSLIVEQAIYEIKLLADKIPDGKAVKTGYGGLRKQEVHCKGTISRSENCSTFGRRKN